MASGRLEIVVTMERIEEKQGFYMVNIYDIKMKKYGIHIKKTVWSCSEDRRFKENK